MGAPLLLRAAVVASATTATLAATAPPRVELVWQPPYTQVNASCDASNRYGLEDGVVVRRADGGFSMITAEMWGDPKWVAMRLGVWRSDDALAWTRQRTLRNSSANFDGSDPHSSSWGPFFVHDALNDTWALSYVGYRGAPSNASGWLENFQGTIFSQYASESGDAGLDSDFGDAGGAWRQSDRILLQPDGFSVNGPWPYPCQGLQGTDSMFPYPLNDGTWAALVGTSHQETPDRFGPGKWPVSLATAPALAGPWTRYNPGSGDPAAAPCVDFNGGYSENPIVSRRPDDPAAFQLVMDFIGSEATGFGYATSEDGLAWSTAALVPTPGGCRTPFGLVPMTPAEVAARTPDVLRYGVINASRIGAPGTSLQWLFYTQGGGAFEAFRTAIVQLSWNASAAATEALAL